MFVEERGCDMGDLNRARAGALSDGGLPIVEDTSVTA